MNHRLQAITCIAILMLAINAGIVRGGRDKRACSDSGAGQHRGSSSLWERRGMQCRSVFRGSGLPEETDK